MAPDFGAIMSDYKAARFPVEKYGKMNLSYTIQASYPNENT